MDEDDFISKTQRKRQMTELQDLGEALARLTAEQLKRMEMPENLREALEEARHVKGHEGRRRHMQYVGKIMRNIEAGPISEQLAQIQAPSKKQTALFHVAEKWRTDLLDDPQALARFAVDFPDADAPVVGELVVKVRQERKTPGKSPKYFRELFHMLNGIVQDHARRRRG
jgi:ribosome-associated protein